MSASASLVVSKNAVSNRVLAHYDEGIPSASSRLLSAGFPSVVVEALLKKIKGKKYSPERQEKTSS